VGGTIRGQVYVGSRHAGPGLRVEIRELGRTANTDRKGRFVLKTIPAGTWKVWVYPSRPDTPLGTTRVTVKDGAEQKAVVRIGG